MKRLIFSFVALFELVFSGPVLANDQFALVCNYLQTMDLKDGKESSTSGGATFVFEENGKELILKHLSGFPCDKISKYKATEFNISIDCKWRLEENLEQINSINIHRFSGEISDMVTFKKDGQATDGGLMHSGICIKKTKKF